MGLKSSLHFSIFLIFGIIFSFYAALPHSCLADNWEANIHQNGAPQALVGVDKKNRTFSFFEKRSPLSLRYQYPCVTGQLPGDKYQVNDLKTPEGIYFVEYKIANGLDFKEYGGIAYTLNYPNPVDRLRGKTGYGIWIHSKGFGLAPTKGCVAIDLQNIAEIGPRLTPGLPVIVAEELKGVSDFDNGVPAQLVSLMQGWTEAWEKKSPVLFNYYDPEAYSKSTEDFSVFRQNKARLFNILSFIKIYNREIHALEGPGYWVTWTEQLYTASNLSTEGVRRLYWQKDKNGSFRIVGMEWIPRNLGMAAEYRQGKLVAQANTPVVSDASSEIPLPPRLDMPESPMPKAETPLAKPQPAPLPQDAPEEKKVNQAISTAMQSLANKLLAISDPLVPGKQIRQSLPDEIKWGIGRKLSEADALKAESIEKENSSHDLSGNAVSRDDDLQTASQPSASPDERMKNEEYATEKAEAVGQNPASSDSINMDAVREAHAQWQKNLQNRDLAIMDSYNSRLYNKLPIALGVPRTGTLNSIRQHFRQEFSWPGFIVISRDPIFKADKDIVKSSQEILLSGKQGHRQGIQNLWWQKNDNGEYKVIGSQFTPADNGLEANYLELVSNDIAKMIEEWRKAWETARIDDYMRFYTTDAHQQGRSGANTIRVQKAGLWSRVKPVLVNLSGLRLSIEPNGIRADMHQTFADSLGRTDKGIKTLLLSYDGNQWRIKKEDWTAMTNRQE